MFKKTCLSKVGNILQYALKLSIPYVFFPIVIISLIHQQNAHTHTIKYMCYYQRGTRWPSWLGDCATSRKVAGSIANGVIGFFSLTLPLRPHYGPGVDTASNRNEYQEYFFEVKAAGA